MSALLIRGGRLFDPAHNVDTVGDLLVEGERVTAVEPHIPNPSVATVLDAEGCVVTPAFVDLHCHLREPGQEYKETIESGLRAAAQGGYATVCCMPNTEPALDAAGQVRQVYARAAGLEGARVRVIAAVTAGRDGKALTEMAELREAGAVGFSDDGSAVATSRLMRYALEYAKLTTCPIIDHCEDAALAHGGTMHEGAVATRLGLPGIPAAAEEIIVGRDIALAALTGGWLHIAHASTRGTVALVRAAKARGLRVSAEVTPMHLTMTDAWVAGSRTMYGESERAGEGAPYDTSTRVNPPLRMADDVAALIEGLRDGTIDAIATDHAPHAQVDKECEYGLALSGIACFETALAMLLTLERAGYLTLAELVEKLTSAPATLFGLPRGELIAGGLADLTVFDPAARWTVTADSMASKGKNTPLLGRAVQGKVIATVVGGRLVYHDQRREGLHK